jgi:hypothetical protein
VQQEQQVRKEKLVLAEQLVHPEQPEQQVLAAQQDLPVHKEKSVLAEQLVQPEQQVLAAQQARPVQLVHKVEITQ